MNAKHKDGVDFSLSMVIGPNAEAAGVPDKTAFIAWQEPGQPWRALDLRVANSQSFAENLAMVSSQVNTIIEFNSEIADAIKSKGAGLRRNKRFAAINLRKCSCRDYRISGLNLSVPPDHDTWFICTILCTIQ